MGLDDVGVLKKKTRRNRRVELRSESIENGHERPCDSVLHVVWHGENDSEV